MSFETPIAAKPHVAPWNNPRARGFFLQGVLLVALVSLAAALVVNTRANMIQRGIPLGFDFWNRTAGFDINLTLVSYSSVSTYGRAFLVGLLNTLLVAGLGIILATIVGFAVGVARLSSNFVVAKLATLYVETLRNIPLLLQLLFWYNAVLKPLPNPREAIALGGGIFLHNRGLAVPAPMFGVGSEYVVGTLAAAIILAIFYRLRARAIQMRTGAQKPVALVAVLLVVVVPLIAFFAAGRPIGLDYPQLRGFNFVGGLRVLPEFVALLLGLTLYTATFIAEIVRAGILSVSRGQSEAAAALGLKSPQVLKLVVLPQAMRVIVPPLTNQFLNLTKNSSLAVFIGYPDLVQVFAGTVLNQTGAAVQVIAITMAVYLALSLVLSFAMGLYNRRMRLAER
ncbi:MAG TPA: ABC transporter permease subunit [Beijerinckiaceae bacterium]|nr:ABC transporter permease subunit [Beijerinckiaceae bacterium]